ncbi:MAG: BlaB/IND/MUS family subclass B1 metallo-beta-lactamase, partial [Sphingobacteriaceae bacterium]
KGVPVSSNGLYVITKAGVVLIDTPWDNTQFQPLLDSIEHNHNKKVIMCVATHSHEDRTAGLEYFKQQGIKTYTSAQTDSILQSNGKKRAEFTFKNDTTFKVGELVFKTFYGGQGHTEDNIVVWFKKDRILHGGCLIKSLDAKNLGNIAEANLEAWPVTLNRVKSKFDKPALVIPGHDSWTNINTIDHTLMLLKQHKYE